MSWSGGFDDFADVTPLDRSPAPYSRPRPGPQQYGQHTAQPGPSRGQHTAQPGPSRGQHTAQPGPSRGGDGTKVTIEEISSMAGSSCPRVVGVVIAKEDPRHFPSKKDPNSERHVLSFTLRDSPADLINVTCWGGEAHIGELAGQFHIGDVIEVSHANIHSKPQNGSDEKFRPWTPNACTLNVSENKGTVRLCTDWNFEEYLPLMHIPSKPSNDYYTIGDIVSNGQGLHGQSINILAVVKQVGSPVEVTTKVGRKVTRCEVKLFDDTNPSLTIVLWDKELIRLTEGWVPKDHVIFAIDVRVNFNDFKKCMVATANSKTVITVNPDTREAHSLYRYAETVDLDELNATEMTGPDGGGNVDITSITDVYTVEQIKARQAVSPDVGGTVHGICFCCPQHLDLDGNPFSVVSVRCTKCRYRVDSHAGVCMNTNCPQGSMLELDAASTDTDTVYDVRASLADHTGTLATCRMAPDCVQKMLRVTPPEFLQLSDERKTELKWNYLLERCKVYFKLALPTFERPQPLIRILSCERADLQEFVQHLQCG